MTILFRLATPNGKRNVSIWRMSVCPIGTPTATHQGAACDAASVHFGLTIKRTVILVLNIMNVSEDLLFLTFAIRSNIY